MKKVHKLTLLIGFGAIGLGLALFIEQKLTPRVEPMPPVVEQQVQKPNISVQINQGDGTVETYEQITAETAFDALTTVANQKNIPVAVKEYDFGIMVEGVGNLHNSPERYWMYFINGSAGVEAANKAKLAENDVVEWKYSAPESVDMP